MPECNNRVDFGDNRHFTMLDWRDWAEDRYELQMLELLHQVRPGYHPTERDTRLLANICSRAHQWSDDYPLADRIWRVAAAALEAQEEEARLKQIATCMVLIRKFENLIEFEVLSQSPNAWTPNLKSLYRSQAHRAGRNPLHRPYAAPGHS